MKLKKIFAVALTAAVIAMALPVTVMAAGDTDFTDATGDESGTGWTWTNESKTLTLNGAAITDAVVLPDGASVVVTEGTANSVTVASGTAIEGKGDLSIKGTGKLIVTGTNIELNQMPKYAVVAPSVSITNAQVDLYGYDYGIQAKTTSGNADSVVTLNNVSGKVAAYVYGGINAHSETANVTVKLTGCENLEMYNKGDVNSGGVNFYYAGIRAYTRGDGKNALVEINNCMNVSISNSTMAIVAASNADTNTPSAAKVLIEDSTDITLTGGTTYYSAVFVNNNGNTKDNTSNLVIESSTVAASAPNTALMTSTDSGKNADGAPSEVDIINSTVQLDAGVTGIRTIAKNSDYAETEVRVDKTPDNEITLLVFLSKPSSGAVDESAGGVMPDEDFADNNSTVIVPVGETKIEAGGGEWTIPAGGTVTINGTEVTLPKGGTIGTTGTISAPEVVIGDATVTAPEGGKEITIDANGTVTAPEGSTIKIGDETITVNEGNVTIDSKSNTVTVPEGSEVKVGDVTVNEGKITVVPAEDESAEDKVTVSADSKIEVDGKEITVGEGDATITPEGDVELPKDSEIEIGDTKITVGEGGTTITPGEDVNIPKGSKIEIGEDTEITVGEGGAIIDSASGEITLPEGSKIVVGDTEIIVGDGEGEDDTVKIDPENGTVIIPEGSTITQGNGTVIESVKGDLTVDDNGNVVIPEGGTVNVNGRPTVFPNGGGIDEEGNVTYEPSPSTSSKKSTKKYAVSIDADEIENGSIKLSPSKAKKGATVTLTVTPDAGYELDKLVVLDKDGNEVELKDKGDGKFTFKMPRGGVEVDAAFVEMDTVDADDTAKIVLTIDSSVALVNGEPIVNDVAPIVKGERTFLPIRLIAEELGATVTWNEAEQTVTIEKGETTIIIYIGEAFALVSGEPVQLDAPAFIANDRTYLPIRFIAENLGAEVIWDDVARTVTIIG